MLVTRIIALAAISFPAAFSQLVVTQPTAQHWCTFPFERVALRIPIHLQHVLHSESSCQLTIRGRERTSNSRMDWQYASRLSGVPRSFRCQCIARFSLFLSSCPFVFTVPSRPLFRKCRSSRYGIDRDILPNSPPLF